MNQQCRRTFSMVFFFILFQQLQAQEMLGVMNSNYTGIAGAIINPANTASSELSLNINLLAGDIFISSNYIFIHKKDYGFLKLFKVNIMDPQYLYIYDFPATNYHDSVYYFDYFKNSKLKNIYFNGRIAGPSVMYHTGRHAFSFITGLRNNISVVKLPGDLANFFYRGMQFRPQQSNSYSSGVIRFTELSWAEIGLGYANTIHKDFDYELNAGIMVKGLLGLGGAYGVIKNVTYMIPNIDSIYVTKLNGSVGFSLPFNASNNTAAINPLIKGTGASMDIGVSYIKFNQRSDRNKKTSVLLEGIKQDYLYKAGISLIDVGMINFNKLVQVHEFNDVNNKLWSGLRTFNPNNFQQILQSASFNLLGDSTASLTSKQKITIWLPTALSAQFDYNFGNNVFVNATFLQGIRLGTVGVRRSALISVTPRYEVRYFEVNMPVSFYDYRDPQIGLAIRIFNLVIGTEKLGTFLHVTDVNGMDLYFALGFNLSPKTRSHSSGCDSYENYKRYQTK